MPARTEPAASRYRRGLRSALTGLALLIPASAAAAAVQGPAGTWRVEDGKAVIRIVDCGGRYCPPGGSVDAHSRPVSQSRHRPGHR